MPTKKATVLDQESKDVPDEKLTRKQELFIYEYLKDFNATRAAKAAGYKEKAAYRSGFENLRKPQIRKKIDGVIDDRKANLNINQERVLRELEIVGFARIKSYVRVDAENVVTLTPTDDLEEGQDAAVQSYTHTNFENQFGGSETTQIKMHDKLKALEMLAKHMKLFPKDTDDTDGENKPSEVERVRRASGGGLQETLSRLAGRRAKR